MTSTLEADYVVVGAGAAGMAFADALIDHSDARVVMVDRRHSVGGHWLEAYPFVRLHQSSTFYGVASTLLGGGVRQTAGPEAGLHERASQPEITAYFARALQRMEQTGRVEFHPNSDVLGDAGGGRTIVSRLSGARFTVPESCRIVDAHYVSPTIPSEVPPPFAVADGVHVLPVNDLVQLDVAPSQYVVVGSGKTATDACIWLLGRGVDPDAICWVRPRDPWMLNRALVQPDPAIYLGLVADMMQAAAGSTSLDEVFVRLEDAGVMLRIDPSVTPTMAKAPTLGTWELDKLRTIENVVRLGHIRSVSRGRMDLVGGSVAIAPDAVVVHCAADGLRAPPLVPVWQPSAITLQPIRAGFPCFGAALVGYVEATRDDDADKNRLCPPSHFGNSLEQWASMNVRGIRASQAFSSEPDIKAWADRVALNPARVPPEHPGSAELSRVQERLARFTEPALARLVELC